MKLVVFQCEGKCQKKFSLATESPEGFDFAGFRGVYYCPICNSWDIKIKGGPWDIHPPRIKLKNGNTSNMAKIPQSENISIEQLHSNRCRDDEFGERALPELEQPVIDGVVQSRPFASRPNTKAQYEAECERAMGIGGIDR